MGVHAVDHEQVADVLTAVDHAGSLVPPLRVDVVDVGPRGSVMWESAETIG